LKKLFPVGEQRFLVRLFLRPGGANANTQARVKDTRTARLRMDAASAILDRGIGKPGQSLALQLDIRKKLSELTDDEMVELARRWPELEASEPLQIEHGQKDE
jgi:hypothetical protein